MYDDDSAHRSPSHDTHMNENGSSFDLLRSDFACFNADTHVSKQRNWSLAKAGAPL
jgi:hypothetical protein